VRTVVRPTWRGDDGQRRLVDAVNAAIDHAAEVAAAEEAKIWAAAQTARMAGVPDTALCRLTGLNRATMNRKLGPRPSESDPTPDH
jgi:hypothetical protein